MVVWVAENAVEHAEEVGEAREKWVNIIVDDQVVIEEVVEAGAQEDEEGVDITLRRSIWELRRRPRDSFK